MKRFSENTRNNFGYSLSLTLSSLLFAQHSFAEDDQRIYRSAHYTGRGDTGVAVADDHEAIIYNPAGIAQGKGIYKKTVLLSPIIEFSDDARSMAQELSDEDADTASILRKRVGKNQHLGLYNLTALVLRRAAIGVVAGITTDILVYKSPDAGGLEAVDAKIRETMGPTFSIADGFFSDRLLVGGTFKYLHRGQAQINASVVDAEAIKNLQTSDLFGTGTGTSIDLGMMLKSKHRTEPSLGITIHNVGGTEFSPLDESLPTPDPLLQTIDVGVAIQPGTKMSKFKLLADYKDVTSAIYESTYKKIHLGAELSIKEMVGFTAGLAQGWSSAGMYLDLYFLRLDGGVYIQEMTERAGIRGDKRLFVRISAGF
jgi:hypothetical protein